MSRTIKIGLDIGAVSAKLVAKPIDVEHFDIPSFTLYNSFYVSPAINTMGDPVAVTISFLEKIHSSYGDTTIQLNTTGTQARLISKILSTPHINGFKATSRGTAFFEPNTKTILEIGGDGSKYIQIDYDKENDNLSIVDYEKNGDCAAGTGSFIDQQANRLNYKIDEIGPLVSNADGCANIAGRCSVFAKSDMIHAQQRGYSPGAIFKGLCEAVVRNYVGTVLRGKDLNPTVALVGGVAANNGVVQAFKDILKIDDIFIPKYFSHVGAWGCTLIDDFIELDLAQTIKTLKNYSTTNDSTARSQKLTMQQVVYGESQSTHQNDTVLQAYLGLDIGSVSTNLVLLDTEGVVIDEIYTRTEGKPVEVIQREFQEWQKKWGDRVEILGVGSTGSGRELIGELVGADAVHDEITAHKTGAAHIANIMDLGSVDTIFEIGGQDSKYISIDDEIVVDFAMNEACAAGTGSFLEEQATKLGISIKEEFANLAMDSNNPLAMGERCTVFMEKDVTMFLQQGLSKNDITAGLAYAVAHNYLNRVVRDRRIGDVIFFQGGTAYNKSVAAAFSTILGKKIIVPPHNGVMGAVGAALLARKKMQENPSPTKFRQFDLKDVNFDIRYFICKGCSNQCDIQEVKVNGEKTYWGDKCSDRFRKKRKVEQQPVIPDLIQFYNELLTAEQSEANELGVTVGIPRTMYFYDRFPFWNKYFEQLGARVVISDVTNKKIASKGRELAISEPCFPIVAGHGHFEEIYKDVDYIFMPSQITAESTAEKTKSWFCPWGQTIPLVVMNAVKSDADRDKMLIPFVHFRDGIEYVKKAMHPIAQKLSVSKKKSDKAIEAAYETHSQFNTKIRQAGLDALKTLKETGEKGIILIGRPYNLFDKGVNINVPTQLRENYGINIIPLNFLPLENIDISDVHENMFWNYGRIILQAARFASHHENLHVIYVTNFKCGPDSYIKHFVTDALKSPYLTLQFDDHSNDAGIMTRCEAYLESKEMLQEGIFSEELLEVNA